MPHYRRKPVPPVVFDPQAHKLAPTDPVFQMRFTNEIFATYEEYLARLHLYRERSWQCTRTGRSGLTFEEAQLSEQTAPAMSEAVQDCIQAAMLPLIHYQNADLKSLADTVYASLEFKFVVGEHVDANVGGRTYLAELLGVVPPDAAEKVGTDGVVTIDAKSIPPSPLGTAVSVRNEFYLRIIAVPRKGALPVGTIVRARGSALGRRRGALSRELIKRFIRDTCTRELWVNSPWIAHQELVDKFDLPREPPSHISELMRRHQERLEMEANRERFKEEKKREREDQRAERKKQKLEEPKPARIRYPIEDAELPEDSSLPPWPVPSEEFSIAQESVPDLIGAWVFLQAFAKPLSLYPFGLDDLENALRYNGADCVLVHATHIALLRVIARSQDGMDQDNPIADAKLPKHIDASNWTDALRICLLEASVNVDIDDDETERLRKLAERVRTSYETLPIDAKLTILKVLIDACITTPAIRKFMDECDEEAAEVARQKRMLEREIRLAEREFRLQSGEGKSTDGGNEDDEEGDGDDADMSDDSDSAGSRADSPASSTATDDDSRRSRADRIRQQKLARQIEERRRQAEQEREREEARKRNQEARALHEMRKTFENEQRQRQRKLAQLGDQLLRYDVLRLAPLGTDRAHRAYYFIDGLGGGSGQGSGAGRLFVCENGGKWSYYATPEELEQLIAHLNTKGIRESALKKGLVEHQERIVTAMRRRQKELASALDEDSRRSTRQKVAAKRLPYMQYYNRWDD